MRFNRSGGILLHPTSLPGKYGIGDLGPNAYRWVDLLAETNSKLWQILPLGQTGYGDSPYQCFSAFAGNIYLISPEALVEDDLLEKDDLEKLPHFPTGKVDFGLMIEWKNKILALAAARFLSNINQEQVNKYNKFCEEQSSWLDDYALFMVLKSKFASKSWLDWPLTIRKRDHNFLSHFIHDHKDELKVQKFYQFLFFKQWLKLKLYANNRAIEIIGDTPIFVAMDSADVWTHPDLFRLNERLEPEVVAGVPPDYFSKTGQLWGNPLYDWSTHKETNYRWWIDRIKSNLQLFDYIRLDHFRGFSGYWEVPAHMPTAEIGRWLPGPGEDLFDALIKEFSELPIIAEDLGVITADVVTLKDRYKLPGMKVMQFAFDQNPANAFLPHNYEPNCVAYTGTHDNDTSLAWFIEQPEDIKNYIKKYLNNYDETKISTHLIREIWRSVAVFAIAPLQDFLSLGRGARMNYPGRPDGNWAWRMTETDLENNSLKKFLKDINFLYYR